MPKIRLTTLLIIILVVVGYFVFIWYSYCAALENQADTIKTEFYSNKIRGILVGINYYNIEKNQVVLSINVGEKHPKSIGVVCIENFSVLVKGDSIQKEKDSNILIVTSQSKKKANLKINFCIE